jgi:hypothetical protein
VREGKVTGKSRLLDRREDSCPAVELPHSSQKTACVGHAAADGEALSSWKPQEREAGEVLGGLGVDDDAVGGEWVGYWLKPRAQSFFYFVLRELRLRFGVFKTMAHFVEDVEVVLDVLNGAVFWEFVQEGFDLLFGVGHYGFVANIPLRGLLQASQQLRVAHPLQRTQRMGHPPGRGSFRGVPTNAL